MINVLLSLKLLVSALIYLSSPKPTATSVIFLFLIFRMIHLYLYLFKIWELKVIQRNHALIKTLILILTPFKQVFGFCKILFFVSLKRFFKPSFCQKKATW